MKTYKFKNGVKISLRKQPCATFYAMGETHIEEKTVFDVFQNGRLLATEETWDQAKRVTFNIIDMIKHSALAN